MEKEIKEEVFNNLGREIRMLSMGVSLIIDEYKKLQENGETEISSDLKEKLMSEYLMTMNHLRL